MSITNVDACLGVVFKKNFNFFPPAVYLIPCPYRQIRTGTGRRDATNGSSYTAVRTKRLLVWQVCSLYRFSMTISAASIVAKLAEEIELSPSDVAHVERAPRLYRHTGPCAARTLHTSVSTRTGPISGHAARGFASGVGNRGLSNGR